MNLELNSGPWLAVAQFRPRLLYLRRHFQTFDEYYFFFLYFSHFTSDLSHNQLTAIGKRTLRGLTALRNLQVFFLKWF